MPLMVQSTAAMLRMGLPTIYTHSLGTQSAPMTQVLAIQALQLVFCLQVFCLQLVPKFAMGKLEHNELLCITLKEKLPLSHT